MLELQGDLWDYHGRGEWIVITTNGVVRTNNRSVMGAGIAAQCAQRFPQIPTLLAAKIRSGGNHVYAFLTYNILTMPTKHKWYERADAALISRSAGELVAMADKWKIERVYLPRPGCSNGRLDWATVKPLLRDLDDRFTVVDLEP